jgi:hypothetical protein
MVVVWKQFHQTTKQVHDYHHDKHSLLVVGLLFMVFFYEWLRAFMGFFTQQVLLHFDVIH